MKPWIKTGLGWGASMFVFMDIIFPLIEDGKLSLFQIAIGIPLWTASGLLFGRIMHSGIFRKENAKSTDNSNS